MDNNQACSGKICSLLKEMCVGKMCKKKEKKEKKKVKTKSIYSRIKVIWKLLRIFQYALAYTDQPSYVLTTIQRVRKIVSQTDIYKLKSKHPSYYFHMKWP